MTKREILNEFAQNNGFISPDELRSRLHLALDRRSVYSYLLRLARQGLLERGGMGRGRLVYRRGATTGDVGFTFGVRNGRYLQAVIEKKKAVNLGGDGFASEREERVRLLRADADMREIELAKERSQLVALSDVEAAMTDLVLTTKARVMAIAPQLAPELVGETSRVMIQAKIDKAHRKALCYLAKAANDRNPSEGNHGATGTVPIQLRQKKNHAARRSASVNQDLWVTTE